ncbi:hypothetical protein KPC_3553 [Acinetobacter stercoris]|uniref:Uncharacterized protein n=1 Tax=Acinetobacter stercoris TaxID=2126983 RepID=A0A2U3N445_9GAMM|nr:hypothetical protein KPC_3553 [Acinetobacter stercoris]
MNDAKTKKPHPLKVFLVELFSARAGVYVKQELKITKAKG